MKAKKFIENKREGEYEIIKNHIIDIPINTEQLKLLVDELKCYDDSEMAFFTYGMSLGWEGDEIYCIDINKFLDGLKSFYDDNEEEEVDMIQNYGDLIETLKKYPGYDLYPE